MKLTFLGTSHGVPDESRHCCSVLIEVGERAYLIDGGAPIADILLRRGIAASRVKALFNTHVHSDHILGALPFFSLINWYYKDATLQVYLPEAVACDAIRDMIALTDGAFDQGQLTFIPYSQELVYDDGYLRLTPIPTRHMAPIGRPSYGFLVEADGRRVLFSGDLSADLSDFPALLYRQPVDLFVTECAHFSVDALVAKLSGQKAGRQTGQPALCAAAGVIHIHPLEEKQPQIRAAASRLPFPLTVFRDGEEILL